MDMSETITNVYQYTKPDRPFFIFKFSDGEFIATAEYPEEGKYQLWGPKGVILIDLINDKPLSESHYPSVRELDEDEVEEEYPELFELDESDYPTLSEYEFYWETEEKEVDNPQARSEAIKNI